MRGIILCGGTGSRLYPLTKATNKHLLPVGNLPMVLHGVHRLKQAGITNIVIVTGTENAGDFMKVLGSGGEYGVSLTYKIQDKAGGIAEALGLCEDVFRKGEKFVVILGDNIFEDDLTESVNKHRYSPLGTASVMVKRVDDPERFGVADFHYEGQGCAEIVRIVEKPKDPPSNYAVVGIYMFDTSVFSHIKTIERSDRGELEIADVLNQYISDRALYHSNLEGYWRDAGTLATFAEVNAYFQKKSVQKRLNKVMES